MLFLSPNYFSMSWITTFRQINFFVYIAVLVRRIISTPTIGKYRGDWLHRIAHERNQTASRLLHASRIIHSANWIGMMMAHEPTITSSQ